MEKYISKDALVTKIERMFRSEETWMEKQGYTGYHQGLRDAYRNMLVIIDEILEVKEVDLKNEINKALDNITDRDLRGWFRHFFELGLKTQKGE